MANWYVSSSKNQIKRQSVLLPQEQPSSGSRCSTTSPNKISSSGRCSRNNSISSGGPYMSHLSDRPPSNNSNNTPNGSYSQNPSVVYRYPSGKPPNEVTEQTVFFPTKEQLNINNHRFKVMGSPSPGYPRKDNIHRQTVYCEQPSNYVPQYQRGRPMGAIYLPHSNFKPQYISSSNRSINISSQEYYPPQQPFQEGLQRYDVFLGQPMPRMHQLPQQLNSRYSVPCGAQNAKMYASNPAINRKSSINNDRPQIQNRRIEHQNGSGVDDSWVESSSIEEICRRSFDIDGRRPRMLLDAATKATILQNKHSQSRERFRNRMEQTGVQRPTSLYIPNTMENEYFNPSLDIESLILASLPDFETISKTDQAIGINDPTPHSKTINQTESIADAVLESGGATKGNADVKRKDYIDDNQSCSLESIIVESPNEARIPQAIAMSTPAEMTVQGTINDCKQIDLDGQYLLQNKSMEFHQSKKGEFREEKDVYEPVLNLQKDFLPFEAFKSAPNCDLHISTTKFTFSNDPSNYSDCRQEKTIENCHNFESNFNDGIIFKTSLEDSTQC